MSKFALAVDHNATGRGPEQAALLGARQMPGEWMFIRSWPRGTDLSEDGLKIGRLRRIFDATISRYILFYFTESNFTMQ